MHSRDDSEAAIGGTPSEVVSRLVSFAKYAATEAGQTEFPAEAFVSDWLRQPNAQLHGLPPGHVLGDIRGQGAVAALLADTLRSRLKFEGPL